MALALVIVRAAARHCRKPPACPPVPPIRLFGEITASDTLPNKIPATGIRFDLGICESRHVGGGVTWEVTQTWSAGGSHGQCRPTGGRPGGTLARGVFCPPQYIRLTAFLGPVFQGASGVCFSAL